MGQMAHCSRVGRPGSYAPGMQFAVRCLMALLVAVYVLLAPRPALSNPLVGLFPPLVYLVLVLGYLLGHTVLRLLWMRGSRQRREGIEELASWYDTLAALTTWQLDPFEPAPMMILVLLAALGNGIQHGEAHFRRIVWGSGVGSAAVIVARAAVGVVGTATLVAVAICSCLLVYAYLLVRRLERATAEVARRERASEAAAASLQQANRKLAMLEKAFETTRTGITIKDRRGKIIYANPADARLHGYDDPSQVVGMDGSAFGVPDRRRPQDSAQLAISRSWTRESLNRRRDGSLFPALLTSDVIRDDSGRAVAVVTTCEDVTEHKEREGALRRINRQLQETSAQLIHAERLTALGELAASVAHELNQPLNSIKMGAQSILRYLADYSPEELRQELDEVVDAVDEAAAVVSHVKTFARQTAGAAAVEVQVEEVLERSLALMTEQVRAHGIEIARGFEPDLPPVECDPIALEQILVNLLTNARQALEACDIPDKWIELRIGRGARAGTVVVEVGDTGPGVPEGLQQRIFEPFFTTKEVGVGTGLGLAIVRRMVEQLHGTIDVDNRREGGAVFRVTLPASRKGTAERGNVAA